MVLWCDVDTSRIEVLPAAKERSKYKYQGAPLRFQIPRGRCTWGVSAYKSLQVDMSNPEFLGWWRSLETTLCPMEPFASNLNKSAQLRVKVDDATYVFDSTSLQVTPEMREGLFRGQELSCLLEIDTNYFFNGNWGLTVRAAQIRYYEEPSDECETVDERPLAKGVCAFLTT